MKIIKVKLKNYSYPIVIGNHVIKDIGRKTKEAKIGRDAFIITNTFLKNKYGHFLAESFKKHSISFKFRLVADSEGSKSLAVAYSVIKDLADYDLKRKIFLVALGGGVIGDLSGFVASIYKRGIPYLQVPTTLLAQVDSSIGGKTGVDLASGKNLIGVFYQPRLIISEISFLKSLSSRELSSGLAEIIKYGIIKDRELFMFLERNYKKLLSRNKKALEFVIKRCASIKAEIIGKDERDTKGVRAVLNFGHTIGHAIEQAGSYKKYNHGEAVALGMLIACAISREMGMLSTHEFLRIENLLRKTGLPLKLKGIKLDKIIKAHFRDKKFSGKKNRFILLEEIGKARIKEDIPLGLIKEKIKERLSA